MPLDGLPPTTVDGLVENVESTGRGGGASGVNVRTADQAPATPAVLSARTRQKCGTAARPLVAYIEPVRV